MAHWYGNDRIETDITVGYADVDGKPATTSRDTPTISFAQVRTYPFVNASDPAGTPLCSPDLELQAPVGSYQFLQTSGIAPRTPTITPITLPIDPLLPLTDLIVRDGIAYVSADSSVSSDPDLIIADIHDPHHPTVSSSLNTGPGIDGIALAGNHIFAAASSAAAELHVIRLTSQSSPLSPTAALAKKYRLPLPQASTSPPLGSSISYNKGTVYLGTDKWDGSEFAVIDVSSSEDPVQVGGFETGSKVNSISIRNGTAYVADSDQAQLRVLDVNVRTTPRLLYSFSPSGWQRQTGETSSVFEDSLVFGRTSGGFDIPTDLESFAWPISVPTSTPPFALNVSGGVYGLVADRHHVYAATRTNGQEFSVYDRSLATATAAHYPLPVAPQTITCDEDKLYILAHTAPVIYQVSF